MEKVTFFENKNFFSFFAKLSTFTWATNFECMFGTKHATEYPNSRKGGPPFPGNFQNVEKFLYCHNFFK